LTGENHLDTIEILAPHEYPNLGKSLFRTGERSEHARVGAFTRPSLGISCCATDVNLIPLMDPCSRPFNDKIDGER
jgi:hypothetical protein